MRRRPNFSVAVTVVVLTIALALAASFIRPLIPTPASNPIANYSGDYLKQAASQEIEWHPCDDSAFSEARRLDRPVLLFIGVSWSQAARELDTDVLSNSDVQNYLLHNFVCVRIDGSEMPAWVSAYLPLSRIEVGIRPRFQIWALQPDGKLIDNINRRLPTTKLGPSNFLDDLIRVHDFYTELRQRGASGPMEGEQISDLTQIESQSPSNTFDFGLISSSIRSSADIRNGGFPINGFQDLRPFAWNFLLRSGQANLSHDTLMPMLRSRGVDVLDGGFFQTSRSLDHSLLEFDKSSTINAEMAWTLSQARPFLRDRGDLALCDYVLATTLTSLTDEFRSSSGFVSTARIGDDIETGRSARSSVTPQQMRDNLDSVEREWARLHLGLYVETNPQMIPAITSADALSKVDVFRTKISKNATPAKFTSNYFMDVNGTVAARLMEIGRAAKNQKTIDFASSLFSSLDQQRVGDTVPHDLLVSGRTSATLLDYLGYSDAALQDYLSSGRVPSLQSGVAVLQRGLATFAGPVPGEYRVGLPPSSDLLPKVTATAQIVDDLGESASAKVVRLCMSYGRLLIASGDESDTGLSLLRIAYATEALLAGPAARAGIMASSFACASLSLTTDEYAIAVGPDAQRLADELYASRPTRFVAAAFGPVRPDLSAKPAGIYIVKNGEPLGPYSVEQARDRLPLSLVAQ